jgi:hypothetical protein
VSGTPYRDDTISKPLRSDVFQSLGNHEFDNGVKDAQSFVHNITVPVVCSNLDLSGEPSMANEPNLMKSKVLTVNGRKIGIIGYLLPETMVSGCNRLEKLRSPPPQFH